MNFTSPNEFQRRDIGPNETISSSIEFQDISIQNKSPIVEPFNLTEKTRNVQQHRALTLQEVQTKEQDRKRTARSQMKDILRMQNEENEKFYAKPKP
jgi:hypothetical protein